MPGLTKCTNDLRREAGVPVLRLNHSLQRAALFKIQDVIKYQYWAHQNPVTGEYPWSLMDRAGYYYKEAGENLAFGYDTTKEVCNAWRKSPGHLANITDTRYQDFGMAIRIVDLGLKRGIFVVQLFGKR